MNSDELSEWLLSKGCSSQIVEILKENNCDEWTLLNTDEDSLIELGIGKLQLRALLKLVKSLNSSISSNSIINENNENSIENSQELDMTFQSMYQIKSVLGQGAYGKVFKVQRKQKPNLVRAVKVIQDRIDFSINDALGEVMQTIKVAHDHIIKIHDVKIGKKCMMIEMDCLENGNLFDYFVKNRIKPSGKIIKSIIEQIVKALKFMHERHNMIHRDIKLANILIRNVDLKMELIDVCLADFGFAKSFETSHEFSNIYGTFAYLAPEVLNNEDFDMKQPYTMASDIFALGVTVFYLMTSNTSIKCNQNDKSEILRKILNECGGGYNSKLIDFVIEMMNYSPQDRPLTTESLNEAIIEKKIPNAYEQPKQQEQTPSLEQKHTPIDVIKNNHSTPLKQVESPKSEIIPQIVKPTKQETEIIPEIVKPNKIEIPLVEGINNEDEIILPPLKRIDARKEDWYAPLQDDNISHITNRDTVLRKVQEGYSLQLVNEIFRKDEVIVLNAIYQSDTQLLYADESLKKDRNFILKAVTVSGWALHYADEQFKKDRQVVKQAVKSRGKMIGSADESFKKDRELVMLAVKNDGLALEKADISLRKDREIVLQAVNENGNAYGYMDESLRKDREICLLAVQKSYGSAFMYIDESLQNDREFVLETVQLSGSNLIFTKAFQKDRGVVLQAVKSNGRALEYADPSLKKDREIVIQAIKNDGYAIKYVHKSLRKDKEILNNIEPNGYRQYQFDESDKTCTVM